MVSEEKMVHMIHLMLDAVWKGDMVDFLDEEGARREARKVGIQFINDLNTVGDIARKKILSQKSPPRENTPQWDVLYKKYFEEEMAKKGG